MDTTTHHSTPRHHKAFTLIEVTLAVGVLTIAVLTLIGLLGSTFSQVEEVVQTNRALSVIQTVNAALDSPKIIAGDTILEGDKDTPDFDRLYTVLSRAVDKKVILFFYTMEVKNDKGSVGTIPIVHYSAGGIFTPEEYVTRNGVGPVFRVELSISKLLEKQQIELDTKDAIPKNKEYDGGALPAKAEEYALAFLPLYAEVYIHPPNNLSPEQIPASRPILGANIIINR
ncbi:MAG: hypothetical protein LBD01_03990 [Puniceicoccales bacterium]|jgi:uncharacterized protein (TIGR02598 family)|nr:hypothetical protein [Puniceicoccales bacterium]